MTVCDTLLSRLTDRTLVREAGFVGGAWRARAGGGDAFAVTNPSTGAALAVLPDMGADETRAAVDAAHAAQKAWAARTGKERGAVLRRWHDLMVAHRDDLAAILTAEMGKPLAEARGEILYGASYVEWYAEEAKRIYGDVVPGDRRGHRLIVLKQPVGVVAAITPWNFPNSMLARKLAPALATGCAVVAKPAAETPLSALALAVLAERAGLPAGLLSVVPTRDAQGFGEEVCRNPKVRKLTFTGSTPVGRRLMRQAADRVMKLGLELGGNAPFIVFDDADLDAAVEGAIVSKYRNAGQTCVCANRIYVQSGIHDAFAARLAERVAGLTVGDGFDEGTVVGPLIDERAVAKVLGHVADARARGARVAVGGGAHRRGGLFVEPTVLTGVTMDMAVAREEIFGPVAPLLRFDRVDEVVAMANATEYGLAAYFYARDLDKVWAVAEALEFGMVGVNTGLISTEVAPFGGIKQSGLGREGSRYGADDYLELKYVCMAAADVTP
ncbi:NAD-dependent succinate-semialdehyde dehydrogenase [Azospirillum sp. ST 5-10]|uniref:NAD-dependent succinate-semialdehyde dehydrogenase n=1 Tax=unclassified Azospirillum TaxID=2630922 RepID=UPI003F49D56A